MTYEYTLSAFSHPLRQKILDHLTEHPMSVRELTDKMEASQPVISQHLKVLKQADLVIAKSAGTRNIYEIDSEKLKELRDFWEAHWSKMLASLSQ